MTACWELGLATEGELVSQKSVSTTSCGLFYSFMFGEPVVKYLLPHHWVDTWKMEGSWERLGLQLRAWQCGHAGSACGGSAGRPLMTTMGWDMGSE